LQILGNGDEEEKEGAKIRKRRRGEIGGGVTLLTERDLN